MARRAEVGKGTIYVKFKDKEALFQELIRSRLGQHVLRLEKAQPQLGRSMREAVESILAPLLEQIRTTPMGNLLRLMIAESGRFPQLAEFYYREILQRAMSAISRLARQAMERGELAGDELTRFPQIIGAPVVLTLVWSTLFERFAPLDARALLSAYLDLIFGPDAADPPGASAFADAAATRRGRERPTAKAKRTPPARQNRRSGKGAQSRRP